MFPKHLALAPVFFLLLALLLPQSVSAHTETFAGSLSFAPGAATAACPAPASTLTDLFGFVVITNPGFEHTVTNHIPPLRHVILVDVDKSDDDSDEVLVRRFDTLVALTNASASQCLSITLTVLDTAGTLLAAKTISVNANATEAFFLADLVP